MEIEPFCPGPAQFTCRGIRTGIILDWTLNGVRISTYTFSRRNEFPQNLTLINTSLDINIQLVNASTNSQDPNSINSISTLSVSDVSILNGSSLQCQDSQEHESNAVTISVKGT